MKLKSKNIGPLKSRRGERGNVLFLILIAVALFAALSYAVTQSTRSGGSGAGQETSLINSSQLIQYPASIKTAVVRMIIAGVGASELDFMYPSHAEYNDETNVAHRVKVFHPSGGGATYTQGMSDIIASGDGEWIFNADNQVDLIGTTDTDAVPIVSSADVIAFLPGITKEICTKVNVELGIMADSSATIPTADGSAVDYVDNKEYDSGATRDICEDGTDANCNGTIGTVGGGADHDLDGQAFGCFEDSNSAGTYVYYHVIVER